MEPMLPQPNIIDTNEKVSSPQAPPEVIGYAPESAPNTQPGRAHEIPLTPPVMSSGPSPVPLVTPDPQATTDNGGIIGITPAIADDVDVIEKEWVDKAKKIVELTRSDPHQQEKEVGKLQADYLSKRYNKQVKLSE